MARWCSLFALCVVVTCVAAADSKSRFQPRKPRMRKADQSSQLTDDEMVGNLLHWIQQTIQQRNRKARQYYGGKPEKPRPFEAASYLPPITGYPAAGSRPTPSYNEGTSANPIYQPSEPSYKPETPENKPYQPSFQPSKPTQPSYQPSQPSYQPSQPSYKPSQPTSPAYQPSQPTYQPNPETQAPYQPSFQPSQPTQPSYQPSKPAYQPSQPDYQPPQTEQPSQPSYQPSQPPQTNQPSQPSYQPSQPTYQPSQPTYQPSQPTYQPQPETTQRPYVPSVQPGSGSSFTSGGSSGVISGGSTSGGSIDTQTQSPDDDRHPPHIHAITVDCGKDMMTINIEFNKAYNGIIYSQDHFNEPECIYVRENSNQVKFSFTVSLNTCGTRFFSDFENEGQAYLENVLVLQNEPGIQEVWDHIRRVRCLWEGNLNKQLVSSLSVGMLNQITSNFSGDTAMARLDIQTGRGPFAPDTSGLVKIGETMTLVVTVTGDPGFDILVRECVARDSESRHVVPLTDSNGCVLKPKLFGAFQKTRETGNTGASIIAFAFFKAFKFPDEMDLIIQCEVELCKTDCDVCSNPGSIEPRRRRRDVIHIGNSTYEPSTTISKGFRVVFAEDLPQPDAFCITPSAATWGAIMVLLGSLLSSAMVSYLWQRSRGSVKFT